MLLVVAESLLSQLLPFSMTLKYSDTFQGRHPLLRPSEVIKHIIFWLSISVLFFFLNLLMWTVVHFEIWVPRVSSLLLSLLRYISYSLLSLNSLTVTPNVTLSTTCPPLPQVTPPSPSLSPIFLLLTSHSFLHT